MTKRYRIREFEHLNLSVINSSVLILWSQPKPKAHLSRRLEHPTTPPPTLVSLQGRISGMQECRRPGEEAVNCVNSETCFLASCIPAFLFHFPGRLSASSRVRSVCLKDKARLELSKINQIDLRAVRNFER